MNPISPAGEDCREVCVLLDAYLDSELGPDTARWVLRHLSDCSACESELVARRAARVRLKDAVSRLEPDADFEGALRRRLRQESRRNPPRRWTHLALAAAALLGFFSTALWLRRPAAPDPQAVVAAQEAEIDGLFHQVAHPMRPGLGDHLHCAHFRKFAGDAPSLEQLVAKLGEEYQDILMIVRKAVPADFQVVIGHRCKHRDRQFVHVALRRGDELLSVILTERQAGESFELERLEPALREGGLGVYQQTAGRFRAAAFQTPGSLAYVVSNLAPERNLEIAAALAPELETFLRDVEARRS